MNKRLKQAIFCIKTNIFFTLSIKVSQTGTIYSDWGKDRKKREKRKCLRLDQTWVINFGSTRRKWLSERGSDGAAKGVNSTLIRLRTAPHSSALQNPLLAQLARSMMNGTVLKMEHTMMLTNKGRCRAGGAEAMRDGARAALTTGRRWERQTQTTRDGRWQRVTGDRCYMQHEMMVIHSVAVQQSSINNSD